MGRSQISITLDTCFRVRPTLQRETASKIDERLTRQAMPEAANSATSAIADPAGQS